MYAYNPRKKTPNELEKSLVGADRWDILNHILKELEIEQNQGPKQHWMIIGPRGIGKSHLLTLLYYKIKENQNIKKLWIPVLFPEELRMAGNLSKFLERALNDILLELIQEKNPISNQLKQKIEKIRETPASERVDNLFSLISWIHRETGRFIALITENLQQLLGKKIPIIEQKKLRAFLQTSDALLMVGSATTIFDAVHDHSHPFYHFFHTRRLEDLGFEDIKTLIVNLLPENRQPELIKEVTNKDARLKALYSFTGGNPRMAVFLADIFMTRVPDEMLELMDNILDQLTPYFDGILNETPDYLEEVINTLATFEPAQSPREIASYLEAPPATIRNYLKKLKENGYVRIAFSKGKSNYYCLNEYLYRIWYQMRDSSHREETRWLMELLLMLYSPAYIFEEKKKIDLGIDLGESTFSYKKLIVKTADFIESNPDYCKVVEWCVDSMAISEDRMEVAQEAGVLIKEGLNYFNNKQYEKAIKICEDILNINPESEIGYILWGDCLQSLERYEEAIEKYKKTIEINPKSEGGYILWGNCLQRLERYEEAIEKYKKTIEINPKSEVGYLLWGLLQKEINDIENAVLSFLRSINIGSKSHAGKFDFQTVYNEYILPLLGTLRAEHYIKQYYGSEKDKQFTDVKLCILLILLEKYDTVSGRFPDIIKAFGEKDDKEKKDFDLLSFAIKLGIWLKLCKGILHEALRLVDFYIDYIKALGAIHEKENEVSSFSLDLFKIQIHLNIDPNHIRPVLQRLESEDGVPFSDVFFKVWICVSKPDSIEAQRYLNEKPIAEVVRNLKKQ